MKTVIVLVVLLSAAAFSQTAKVVQLDAADAKKAAALAAEKQRIDDEIENLRKTIVTKYLSAHEGKSSNCIGTDGTRIIAGWDCGNFEFSDDFRFIVPKPSTTNKVSQWPGIITYPNCNGNVCW